MLGSGTWCRLRIRVAPSTDGVRQRQLLRAAEQVAVVGVAARGRARPRPRRPRCRSPPLRRGPARARSRRRRSRRRRRAALQVDGVRQLLEVAHALQRRVPRREEATRGRPRARDRAVRRRAVGDAAARRPRRRGDQDRGPGERRRRRALRAAVPRGRGLAVLRGVQPRQAQRLAGPAQPRPGAPSSRTWCAGADAVYSNLRGDQPEKLRITYEHLRRRSTRGSSAARSPGSA